MNIEGRSALVTGARRGIGLAIARELHASGAKVYAGVRDLTHIGGEPFTPVLLDITDPEHLAAAAERCGDVSILVNNAGALTGTSPLDGDSLDDARHELEVNYLGPLAVSRAFAPVLRDNGGGALVNVLSVLSWVAPPGFGTYCAAKSAAWAMTNTLRVMLRSQRTLVVAVHCGFVDTDMVAHIDAPKLSPAEVAKATIEAMTDGREEVLIDAFTQNVKASLHDDLRLLYPGIQERYDASAVPSSAD
jgi:NAD(P)-dependent dehydrogenase (short-subunit alcohol dehydrogenase family)